MVYVKDIFLSHSGIGEPGGNQVISPFQQVIHLWEAEGKRRMHGSLPYRQLLSNNITWVVFKETVFHLCFGLAHVVNNQVSLAYLNPYTCIF